MRKLEPLLKLSSKILFLDSIFGINKNFTEKLLAEKIQLTPEM